VAVDVVQTGVESHPRVLTKLLETRKVETFLRHDLNVGRPREALVWLLDCQDLVKVEKGGRFTCEGIAGVITDDQDLTNEGKVDRAEGTVKDAADDVAHNAKDIIGKD